MRLDVKRQLFARSERVKGIDFHPTEPWVLTTLYSGHVNIWSYVTSTIIKSFELTDVPVRAGKFVARKNWIVCGSDDFQLRVLNYNTSEKITSFEAHPDYIRAIAVHPTHPYILTASDDMTIKLWDFDNGFKCLRVFEGHAHYVMSIAINPKDTNTFASACLDRTVKIWNLGSNTANFTLEAHEQKGVNAVDYYPQADKPYLLTTSDDRTIKIWDYTTKGLIATLEGHTSNVSFACYHPELPLIISGSEDGTVKLWHSSTYKLEQSLNYGLERAWCVSYQRQKQHIAIGYDDGMVVLKMGREQPAVSMDSSGKIISAKANDIVTTTIKSSDIANVKDGDRIVLPLKELGTTELYPQSLMHSPNGRFVAVCGDGEWIVYTSLALRNQAFGSGLDFCWASKENDKDYAIRESSTSVKLCRSFKERMTLNTGFQSEAIFAGHLLGVKGSGGIGLFDWQTGALARRIEVEPLALHWSESGELVALACADSYYVLRFDRNAYDTAVGEGEVEDDGVESAFEVITDVNEAVTSGTWVGDCFVYTTSTNRLNYLVGEKVNTISHFDAPHYILGYLPRDGRIYICDKDLQVSSYGLSLSVVEYQTLVLRGELEAAQEIPIPLDQKTKIARFLEGQGYKQEALEISTDSEHRFDLALDLGQLDIALAIADKEGAGDHKWRSVGDKALEGWDVKTAESCFWHAKDLGSLLLLYSASGDREGLRRLADAAQSAAQFNCQFQALWLLNDVDACIKCLSDTSRFAEAVFFAQTYKPSAAPKAVQAWKASLEKDGKGRVAKVLGMPPGIEGVDADEDLFPEWNDWLQIEQEGGVKLIDIEDEVVEEEVEGDEEVEVGEVPVDEDEEEEEEAEEDEEAEDEEEEAEEEE
ncbi:hypothetical protein EG328_008753 [Venturia inaequalis]|uniref:Coatomer subunit beta' n=1 Tax=Venturia inaequalis TaxID=5025 RepID=A0A8H3VCI5_VENIN|nr:hypothetical protein EG328_008753 [Venturia inaequalis]KAE9993183.1 hypothetical protein EG327_006182 [Venturia inaequalis]